MSYTILHYGKTYTRNRVIHGPNGHTAGVSEAGVLSRIDKGLDDFIIKTKDGRCLTPEEFQKGKR